MQTARAQGVAHDHERSSKGEEWNRGEGRWTRPVLQQTEARWPMRQQLIEGGEQAGGRETHREREEGLDRLRRHTQHPGDTTTGRRLRRSIGRAPSYP